MLEELVESPDDYLLPQGVVGGLDIDQQYMDAQPKAKIDSDKVDRMPTLQKTASLHERRIS